MRETKTYCDHCGTELNAMRDYDDLIIDMGHVSVKTDLCDECFEELYGVVCKFCGKEKE